MNYKNATFSVLFIFVLMLSYITGLAQTAYIGNAGDNTVSVINVATNTVTDTIKVGVFPYGISVTQDGSKVYVANRGDSTVSVISTATNLVTNTVHVGLAAYDLVVTPDGSKVYVSNASNNKVSVINTVTNTVSTTVTVGNTPEGIAVSPDGSKVYVANANAHTVSVINTTTNTVSATITFSSFPYGVCVSPDGSKVYVTIDGTNKVGVVDAASNIVSDTIPVAVTPWAISVSPDGSKVYAASVNADTVSIINTATNTVSAFIPVSSPEGISFTPDGSKAYVTNGGNNSVTVINTATNAVSATIPVGSLPIAFGNFISAPASPPPVANFQTADSTICANDCISFTDLSINATAWHWHFAGAIDSTSAVQNPQNVCYGASGDYSVTLIASNAAGSDTVTFSNYIHVQPAPPAPVIMQVNDTLYFSNDTSYASYQWSLDSVIIRGATDTLLVITQGGNYNVQVTNENGCKTGAGINTILGLQNYNGDNIISVSPNPATSHIIVHTSYLHSNVLSVSIVNVFGQQASPPATLHLERGDALLDVSKLAAGIYFLQLKSESGNTVKKFVKE